MTSRVCNDISVAHGHQVLSIIMIDELLSQVQSEWIFLCHYWKEICVCPDASSIFYRKIPLYRIAFTWTSLSDVPLLLTWLGTHCCSYQRHPHLYIALSFWFDQLTIMICLGICVSWSCSQIWVVPFCVVFTSICFVFSSRWIAVSFSCSMDWSIWLHQRSVCACKRVGTNHFFQADILCLRSCYHKHPSKEWHCCLQRQVFNPSSRLISFADVVQHIWFFIPRLNIVLEFCKYILHI